MILFRFDSIFRRCSPNATSPNRNIAEKCLQRSRTRNFPTRCRRWPGSLSFSATRKPWVSGSRSAAASSTASGTSSPAWRSPRRPRGKVSRSGTRSWPSAGSRFSGPPTGKLSTSSRLGGRWDDFRNLWGAWQLMGDKVASLGRVWNRFLLL